MEIREGVCTEPLCRGGSKRKGMAGNATLSSHTPTHHHESKGERERETQLTKPHTTTCKRETQSSLPSSFIAGRKIHMSVVVCCGRISMNCHFLL